MRKQTAAVEMTVQCTVEISHFSSFSKANSDVHLQSEHACFIVLTYTSSAGKEPRASSCRCTQQHTKFHQNVPKYKTTCNISFPIFCDLEQWKPRTPKPIPEREAYWMLHCHIMFKRRSFHRLREKLDFPYESKPKAFYGGKQNKDNFKKTNTQTMKHC